MYGLHEKQKRILEFLRQKSDGSTLEELSNHLEVTNTATKEHLIKIDRLGLIYFKDKKGRVGRPRRFYFVSELGIETFPRQYSWLSNILLTHLATDIGPVKTSKLMEALAGQVAQSMRKRFENTQTIPERLAEITRALNELGYRAQLKQSDVRKGAVIEAINCVYHTVAKAHPELCNFDVGFIKHASGGMTVKLESCIAKGGLVCRFCIKKNTEATK